ncbi:MAG: hypothetical protein F6K00_17185 [Leptolyngbya sp. SIOISBB]|nr:hypothetical protein [Leptolyngbya sp. SIOISBB]
MSSPVVHAFFMGRALAAAIADQAEQTMTETLSNLGRFDAEQRENLRNFTEDVMARVQQQESAVSQEGGSDTANVTAGTSGSQDLQATIDNLRAEIAQVRSSLQQYRASLN